MNKYWQVVDWIKRVHDLIYLPWASAKRAMVKGEPWTVEPVYVPVTLQNFFVHLLENCCPFDDFTFQFNVCNDS